MAIACLILGGLLLFSKSKYFPKRKGALLEKMNIALNLKNVIGYVLLTLSYVLFALEFGWGTGFVIYLIAFSFVYALLIMVLPLHKSVGYIFAGLSLVIIVFSQIAQYAGQ
ncbi:MAG: hypothetical protein AAF688_06280 [Bacteroidota bacterium]